MKGRARCQLLAPMCHHLLQSNITSLEDPTYNDDDLEIVISKCLGFLTDAAQVTCWLISSVVSASAIRVFGCPLVVSAKFVAAMFSCLRLCFQKGRKTSSGNKAVSQTKAPCAGVQTSAATRQHTAQSAASSQHVSSSNKQAALSTGSSIIQPGSVQHIIKAVYRQKHQHRGPQHHTHRQHTAQAAYSTGSSTASSTSDGECETFSWRGTTCAFEVESAFVKSSLS